MPLSAIDLSSLERLGLGLARPEDVVVGHDGRVWASDQQSACAEILPGGGLRRVGNAGGEPNGINMDPQGRIIIANFGNGLLQRLDPATGTIDVLCAEIGGFKLRTSNYPIIDSAGNIWCSHSTSSVPFTDSLDRRADGLLYRVRPDGTAEIMAEGLQFANGLALDADESHIYVCQTTGCNVVRYAIKSDGTLGKAEQYGPLLGEYAWPLPAADTAAPGGHRRLGFTDGCGFDAEGHLWVTLVAANQIVAITPAGTLVTVIDDPSGTVLTTPTNVTWGGADMCDLYIGSYATNYVLKTRSPVPGLPLVHQCYGR